MSTSYRPRPDSLASQCIGFFTRNPDEGLTLEDITDKFDATRGNIHTLLKPAVDACLLSREKDDDGDYIYSAGVDLARWSPAAPEVPGPAPEPAAAAPKRGPVKGRGRVRHEIDFDTLTIDKGIPFAKLNGPDQSKWLPLFEKLKTVGDSIALPGHVKGAVAAAVLKRNKDNQGKFRVAMTGGDTARIWRLA